MKFLCWYILTLWRAGIEITLTLGWYWIFISAITRGYPGVTYDNLVDII